MKYLYCLVLMLPFCASAQWEEPELDSLKKIWTKEITLEMNALGIGNNERRNGYSDFSDSLMNIWERDTFLVERLYARMLDEDMTTAGMVQAAYETLEAYDALMNKYYTILLKKLGKNDREVLREAQRCWIKFRDAERTFNYLTSEDKYSGGGTIQRLFYSSRDLEITRTRTQELVAYLWKML